MKPLRLVIVTQRFWPLVGSSENLLGELAVGLHRRGCHVTILTARWQPGWPEHLRFHEVPVVRLSPPPAGGWRRLRYVRCLGRWLKRNWGNYDVVYVSAERSDASAALRAVRGRAPVVLRTAEEGCGGDRLWQQQTTFGRRYGEAAALVAPTASVREKLHGAGYRAEVIHLLPDGVALPPPRTAAVRAAARAALAETHGAMIVPAGAPLAVYAGRFARHQGLRTLLAAWKSLLARRPNARLWLAGDGPERAALQAAIEELELSGRVVLIGVFDGIEELLAAADLFLMPASQPGASRSLREAMAAALPIVASDAAAHRLAIDDEREGLLVPSDDAAAMSAAIERLLAQPDLAAALGTAARARVAHFSLEKMVDEHIRLFQYLSHAQERKIGTGSEHV